jgi:hypothetical protein
MNDRELLEMAARAAGYSGTWIKWPGARHPLDADLGFFHGSDGSAWNPFASDGDALRLAVDLSLTVFTGGVGCVSVSGWIVCGVDAKPIGLTEHYGSGDKYAATRRAIVLAAAEIGRRKK